LNCDQHRRNSRHSRSTASHDGTALSRFIVLLPKDGLIIVVFQRLSFIT
jgi:hypothetical protein